MEGEAGGGDGEVAERKFTCESEDTGERSTISAITRA